MAVGSAWEVQREADPVRKKGSGGKEKARKEKREKKKKDHKR